MKLLKLATACAMLVSANAMALDASSLKVSVYSVMLSTSSLCTSPITIFSSATATEVDFLAAPTLGSGNPPDGTYNCVIIKMSDIIKYTPSTSSGACASSTEYTGDVCRADNNGTTIAPDFSGPATNCTGTSATASADVVYMYLTTNASAGTGGNTFMQPLNANSTNGINLAAPLVIAGTAKSKFIVNAAGKIDGSSGYCGMNPPVFGFQKLP